MVSRKNNSGFTLLEILLVTLLIGFALAVIIPRAWRAQVDAKYSLVRQSGSEAVSYALAWAEHQISSQTDNSVSVLDDYYQSLAPADETCWVGKFAYTTSTNWNTNNPLLAGRPITGRNSSNRSSGAPPETVVEGLVPPERHPKNPFAGTSIFSRANDPTATTQNAPVPGALACKSVMEGNLRLYALLFQGTDSVSMDHTQAEAFHGGQAPDSVEGLRNGLFLARVAPAD